MARIFEGLVGPNIRDVQAPAGSINAELLALPQQRVYVFDMVGKTLWLPRTGITVVPIRTNRNSYACKVIDADDEGIYQPGGYDLQVSDLEMQTAIEMTPVFRCVVCGAPVERYRPPNEGSWFAHLGGHHPADEHDAEVSKPL